MRLSWDPRPLKAWIHIITTGIEPRPFALISKLPLQLLMMKIPSLYVFDTFTIFSRRYIIRIWEEDDDLDNFPKFLWIFLLAMTVCILVAVVVLVSFFRYHLNHIYTSLQEVHHHNHGGGWTEIGSLALCGCDWCMFSFHHDFYGEWFFFFFKLLLWCLCMIVSFPTSCTEVAFLECFHFFLFLLSMLA